MGLHEGADTCPMINERILRFLSCGERTLFDTLRAYFLVREYIGHKQFQRPVSFLVPRTYLNDMLTIRVYKQNNMDVKSMANSIFMF